MIESGRLLTQNEIDRIDAALDLEGSKSRRAFARSREDVSNHSIRKIMARGSAVTPKYERIFNALLRDHLPEAEAD
jgi:hypothetical protein